MQSCIRIECSIIAFLRISKMDEMKTCLLCLIVLSSVLSGTDPTNETIIVQPSVTVTLINEHAFFNCSTTSQKVEWLFGSDQYPQPFIYSYGKVNQIYKDRFRVESYTYNNRKWFNLILRSVAKGDAGQYICRDPDDLSEEGREAHLTVLEKEPACNSNLNSNGLIIGPNSCAIKQETVQLSCGVRYSGNRVPELQWVKSGENIAINSSICSDSGKIYTCNLTMESELQMEGSSYVCQTTQSMTKQYNCTSDVFRILYALGEHTELARTVNDKVNCSVNSSSHACTSSWIFGNGTTNWTISHERVIEFKRPGRYICQADCVIKNINCTFTTMTINVTVNAEPPDDDFPTVKIIIIVGIVIAICVNAFILWKVLRRKKNRKYRRDASYRQNPSDIVGFLSAANAGEDSNEHDLPVIESMSLDVLYAREVEVSNEQVQLERDSMSRSAEQAGDDDIPIVEMVIAIVAAVVIAIHVGLITFFYLWSQKRPNEQRAVAGDIVLKHESKTPIAEENHSRRVRGLVILDDELFVVFEMSSIIEVFPVNSDMSSHKSVEVAELLNAGTIAACVKNSCLYVMDQITNSRKKIFRIRPDGTVINTWETDDDDKGRISVNRDGNVVMTVYDKQKVKIYSPDGTLLRDKTIDFSGTNISYIFHAINLADGNFIIGHGIYKSKLHQVCKIDANGNVLRSFGNEKGSGDAQLNCPAYVAERNDGSILVADQDNHRIIRLNSELEFVEILFTNENSNVNRPKVMFVYEKTETPLLFLGCNETLSSGGYVLVLRLSQ